MSNSSLATFFRLAKWYSPRVEKITKIAVHHMAGVMTADGCLRFFEGGSRYGSSNYCIGYDGSIGLSVPEDKRAWTTSSIWCDERAVTIEVSNSIAKHPWPISDASYKALIYLIVDICRRNGIKDCSYTGGKDGVLQKHSWYAPTGCPGPTLGALFPKISKDVNAMLRSGAPIPGVTTSTPISSGGNKVNPYFAKVTAGSLNIRKSASTGSAIIGLLNKGDSVKITQESGGWGFTPDKNGWISLRYTSKVQEGTPTPPTSPTPSISPTPSDMLSAWIAKKHLKKGSRGGAVEVVQAFLVANGATLSAIDGIFGNGTDRAVKDYQRKHGLDADGIIGQKTWRVMFGQK